MSKPSNRIQAVWREHLTFDMTTGIGHQLTVDARKEGGGDDRGPGPFDLLLAGYAGCTGIDVVEILRKMREPLAGLTISMEGERASTDPRVFTQIDVIYHLKGNLKEKSVQRAIHLSETKYCGVRAMLAKTASITSRYEIEAAPEEQQVQHPHAHHHESHKK